MSDKPKNVTPQEAEEVAARALTVAVQTYIEFPLHENRELIVKLLGQYQTAWIGKRAIAEAVKK